MSMEREWRNINTLPNKNMLSFCKTATNNLMKILSRNAGFPSVRPTSRAALRMARASHSGIVPTKKRGYDITRNPHLNKEILVNHRVYWPNLIVDTLSTQHSHKGKEVKNDAMKLFVLRKLEDHIKFTIKNVAVPEKVLAGYSLKLLAVSIQDEEPQYAALVQPPTCRLHGGAALLTDVKKAIITQKRKWEE
ncbi:UNVERIFIED_CONTAM: hypothetical protein FKN15_001099 [Acipenser sinensis]